MKMVRKSIFALAVVVLMISTVQAGDPAIKKDGDWPWTYQPIDICVFPVYMDVGHYVQLKECHKRELILEQVSCTDKKEDGGLDKEEGDFPCYKGCEEIEVRANFPAIFGATLTKTGNILDQTELYWMDGKNTIDGSLGGEAWEKLTICLDAWRARIWQAGQANAKMKVGEIMINVKPPDMGP
jgi:hypothetical protein